MVCDVCNKGIAVHEYRLHDGSVADICDDCGKILENQSLEIFHPGRLFQIIAMKEFVKYVKRLQDDTNIHYEEEYVKKIAM